jgi:septal ring factor EnvC (AmiA/AmiB activator)
MTADEENQRDTQAKDLQSRIYNYMADVTNRPPFDLNEHAEDVKKYLKELRDPLSPEKQKIVDELNHARAQLKAFPDAIATLQRTLNHAQRERKTKNHHLKQWVQESPCQPKSEDELLLQIQYNRDLFSVAQVEARILIALLENT